MHHNLKKTQFLKINFIYQEIYYSDNILQTTNLLYLGEITIFRKII